jgi:flagellar biosynthetic protein FlhB
MADPSKTEKATAHRLQEAREKGQIAKSVEVNSALVLLAALIAFGFAGPYMVESMYRLAVFSYRNLNASFDPENIYSMTLFYMMEFFKIIAPILGTVLIVGLFSNYLQVGVLFTLKPLVPKFSNINPMTGFQKLFSRRSVVEFFKSLLKLSLVGIIAYYGLKGALDKLVPTMDMQGGESLKFVGHLTVKIMEWILVPYLILALMDYFYQKWEYEDGLKMTKQEVRDEFKQSEGDPMIKARIRQIQREMARRRMFDSIPKADVVITNPTHVAVALQYQDGMQAPMVLAKGERVIAERIKDMARKHGVPIVENPPLARALLKQCPVGAPISADLFGAVAEVLAFVYRLNQKKQGRVAPRV